MYTTEKGLGRLHAGTSLEKKASKSHLGGENLKGLGSFKATTHQEPGGCSCALKDKRLQKERPSLQNTIPFRPSNGDRVVHLRDQQRKKRHEKSSGR